MSSRTRVAEVRLTAELTRLHEREAERGKLVGASRRRAARGGRSQAEAVVDAGSGNSLSGSWPPSTAPTCAVTARVRL